MEISCHLLEQEEDGGPNRETIRGKLLKDKQKITGHYAMLAKAKRGIYPDGRTKLGKSISCFRAWLKEPYGENWNSLQQAREAVALPFLIFWLVCPVLNEDGKLLDDFKYVSQHLERLLRDIAVLATKGPAGVPSLKEWIEIQDMKVKEKDKRK